VRSFAVPEVVRAKAGDRWVSDLPGVVAALEEQWGIVVGEPLGGGTSAYVATATSPAGPAVLKVSVPGVGFAAEVRTLVAADGRGYVRVLAADLQREAALLEALGPALNRSGLAPEKQLVVLGTLLPQAWTVPPDRVASPDSAGSPDRAPYDKAAALGRSVSELWERTGGPCRPEVLDRARAYAARRSAAFDPRRCVVVHGDATAANVLRRPAAANVLRSGDGYVLVDPDGFLGDPAYDLGVAVRDWCPELLAAADPSALLASWCRLLADQTGHDPDAVWEWGYLERVSTGLYALSLGADDLARPLLATAEALLASR
jgi:streptomycin 6-kinase